MAIMVLDRKKMLLFLCALFSMVAPRSANTSCTYTDKGVMKSMQCPKRCCGQQGKQWCCETEEDESNLGLIIGASVAGGVAVLCLIMVIILCCLQKNNVKKVQIHSDNAGQRARGAMSPPPPYNPVNIYMMDNVREQQTTYAGPASLGAQGITSGSGGGPPPPSVPPPYTLEDINPRADWKHPPPTKQ